MAKKMPKQLRPALISLLLFTLITGGVYPALVTGLVQLLFPYQANGSLMVRDGKVIGSELIGQPFADPAYFWGRPSATSPFPYNAAASSGANLGPTNPALLEAVKGRIEALRQTDPDNSAPIPVDLVTTSASGLDPHISPAAAFYQVARVARTRGLPADQVQALVAEYVEGRQGGFWGEPRVNVLKLNLALDSRLSRPSKRDYPIYPQGFGDNRDR
jgi:K+-transporting ATPase ATPase C chain